MDTYLSIDKAGRLVLPKAVRERYGIAYGGRLELVDTGEGLLLRPHVEAPLVKRLPNGFPVFAARAEAEADTTDLPGLVAQSREERDRRNIG